MKQPYRAGPYIRVPDGTEVSPFLNATDISQSNVPWGSLGDMSIAAGRIQPGTSSWIHMHPVVTQVTYITSGNLIVWTKSPGEARNRIETTVGDAIVSQPGSLIQYVNEKQCVAEVLYIVQPSYVFEPGSEESDEPIYDDAILIAETWDDVTNEFATQMKINLHEAAARRTEALRRIAKTLGQSTSSISAGV